MCYSAVRGDAPALNAVEYGWEWHGINRRLITRNMADVVYYAPEHILKLVRSLYGPATCLHNVLWM